MASISREDIIAAYEILLGVTEVPEPTIHHHIVKEANLWDFIRKLILDGRFRQKHDHLYELKQLNLHPLVANGNALVIEAISASDKAARGILPEAEAGFKAI